MVTGGCHCGAIQYQVSGEIRGFMHCHCRTCRKINGTVYGSSGMARTSDFEILSGAEQLTDYESSPGKHRCFCNRCGSHIYAFYERQQEFIVLRMGTLDGDPHVRPDAHIWVSQKAPWYEIRDDLPQFDQELESR